MPACRLHFPLEPAAHDVERANLGNKSPAELGLPERDINMKASSEWDAGWEHCIAGMRCWCSTAVVGLLEAHQRAGRVTCTFLPQHSPPPPPPVQEIEKMHGGSAADVRRAQYQRDQQAG